MIDFFCFLKVRAQIFREMLSDSNSFISGVFCVRTHLSMGVSTITLGRCALRSNFAAIKSLFENNWMNIISHISVVVLCYVANK